MMWLATGILVALALFFLLRPLLRATPVSSDAASYDLEVYRDQLAELGRDRERGLIGPAEAEAAELEIKRRILAADAREDAAKRPPPAGDGVRRLGLGLAIALPLFVGGLYVWLGSPGMPSQPFADRKAPRLDPRVAQVVARLEAEVKAKPEDLVARLKLGQAYWTLQRWREAADAFGAAWKLSPKRSDIGAAHAEALVRAANGIVTEPARKAFARVVELDPNEPRARFFLGLADAQAGRTRAALTRWILLEADTQATAPWLPRLRAEIAKAARDAEIDLAALRKEVLAKRPKRPKVAGTPGGRGPTADDIRRAQKMSPKDRLEMIRGMVSGLEARLKENPKDVAGWKRLGRSYTVLGDLQKAAWAYGKAAEQAPKSTEALADHAMALMRLSGAGKPLSLETVLALRRLIAADPDNAFALYFLGRAEKEAGNPAAALILWRRLLARLPDGSPMRPRLTRDIAEAEKALEDTGKK